VGLRVALISQIPQAVEAYTAGLQALGHEPVGLLFSRATSRYGFDLGAHVSAAPEGIDVVIPASRERIAPLLRSLEPDLALCAGFPWKLPVDALGVPPLGVVNFHPSLLPRYRGPIPVSWAIRNGDREIGVTFHRMAADLDTGPILSQGRLTLGDEWSWDELGPRIAGVVRQILPVALERAERGDPGEPQDESAGEYLSFFEPEYAEIDWSRPAAEIERQVRAWRFGGPGADLHGALTELDGERLRVLRVSLAGGEGRPVECADGTVWVLETEPVGGA
jgi:methionyl-tRNA formyltransferase